MKNTGNQANHPIPQVVGAGQRRHSVIAGASRLELVPHQKVRTLNIQVPDIVKGRSNACKVRGERDRGHPSVSGLCCEGRGGDYREAITGVIPSPPLKVKRDGLPFFLPKPPKRMFLLPTFVNVWPERGSGWLPVFSSASSHVTDCERGRENEACQLDWFLQSRSPRDRGDK